MVGHEREWEMGRRMEKEDWQWRGWWVKEMVGHEREWEKGRWKEKEDWQLRGWWL